jgi:hypothetical protein
MTAQSELSDFERKLESIIKGAFGRVIEDDSDFEIAADYDTHRRIDDVVEGLGLEVYGMSVTPSEFTIIFEFVGPYATMECQHPPRYCRIAFENDGEYSLSISQDDLQAPWDLSITDTNFNIKSVPEEVMLETLKEMGRIMLLTVLSS